MYIVFDHCKLKKGKGIMTRKFILLLILIFSLTGCKSEPVTATAQLPPAAPTPNPTGTPVPTSTPENWDYSLTQIPTVVRDKPDLPEGYMYLHTWCNDDNNAVYNFAKDTPIGFKYGWSASETNQIDEFMRTVDIVMKLNDQPLEFDGHTDIIFNSKTQDFTIWFYELVGPLEPGTYKLEYKLVFTEPYTDGTEDYGPGTKFEETIMNCDFTIENF